MEESQTGSTDDPARLRPIIESAMEELAEADREAVLLRYFQGRDFGPWGLFLGFQIRLRANG